MLYLSNYVDNPIETEGDIWFHPITRQSVGLGPRIRKLLPLILKHNLYEDVEEHEEILIKLLAFELVERGFLLEEKNFLNESEYLKSRCHFELPAKGIFNLDTAYFDLIPPDTEIFIWGVPCDGGASRPGSRFGSSFIRDAGKNINFRSRESSSLFSVSEGKFLFEDIKVLDGGDLVGENLDIHEFRDSIESVIAEVPIDTISFMVGGDHSLTLGALRGLWKKRNGIPFTYVHLDSHMDLSFGAKSEKGRKHQKPDHSDFVSYIQTEMPEINIFEIGINNYQSFRAGSRESTIQEIGRMSGIISDFEIHVSGVDGISSRLPVDREVYISLDVDVLSSSLMEHTGFPSSCGLTFDHILNLLAHIIGNNRVIGIDLVEFGQSVDYSQHNEAAKMLSKLMLFIIERIKGQEK